MKIVMVNESNLHVYLNLMQPYSAEFSPLTKQLPDEDGKFSFSSPAGHTTDYLLYINDLPAGLATIGSASDDQYEIHEFYVLPIFRRGGGGQYFAHSLFDMMPGNWVSKQIAGADHAVAFWRRVIGTYTKGQYIEDMYKDAYWGLVTRQRFSSVKHNG